MPVDCGERYIDKGFPRKPQTEQISGKNGVHALNVHARPRTLYMGSLLASRAGFPSTKGSFHCRHEPGVEGRPLPRPLSVQIVSVMVPCNLLEKLRRVFLERASTLLNIYIYASKSKLALSLPIPTILYPLANNVPIRRLNQLPRLEPLRAPLHLPNPSLNDHQGQCGGVR